MYAGRWGGGCGWPVAGVLAGVVAQVLPMHLLDVDAYELLGLVRGRNYGNSDINKAYRRAIKTYNIEFSMYQVHVLCTIDSTSTVPRWMIAWLVPIMRA